MVARLVRLILCLLPLWLAACTTGALLPPQPAYEGGIPAADPLQGSAAQALLERAVQAREAGDHAQASRSLERAMALAPDSSWLYREAALLRSAEGDDRSAEVMLQRALRLAPADQPLYQAELWDKLAEVRRSLGHEARAEAAQAQAAKLRH